MQFSKKVAVIPHNEYENLMRIKKDMGYKKTEKSNETGHEVARDESSQLPHRTGNENSSTENRASSTGEKLNEREGEEGWLARLGTDLNESQRARTQAIVHLIHLQADKMGQAIFWDQHPIPDTNVADLMRYTQVSTDVKPKGVNFLYTALANADDLPLSLIGNPALRKQLERWRRTEKQHLTGVDETILSEPLSESESETEQLHDENLVEKNIAKSKNLTKKKRKTWIHIK